MTSTDILVVAPGQQPNYQAILQERELRSLRARIGHTRTKLVVAQAALAAAQATLRAAAAAQAQKKKEEELPAQPGKLAIGQCVLIPAKQRIGIIYAVLPAPYYEELQQQPDLHYGPIHCVFTLTFSDGGHLAVLEVRGCFNAEDGRRIAASLFPYRYTVAEGDRTYGHAEYFYAWTCAAAQECYPHPGRQAMQGGSRP